MATHHADMTIDEMMAKYPKANVEMAMFTRNYVGLLKKMAREYEAHIARGNNVEAFKKLLQELDEEYTPAPPIDPNEPKDLDPDVLWRIRVLKYQLRPSTDTEEGRVNIDAVLNAYRQGKLKVDDEHTTIWYAGHMIMGPLPNDDPKIESVGRLLPELDQKYGPGEFHAENHMTAMLQQGLHLGHMVDDIAVVMAGESRDGLNE
ncbi:hypothetical protein FQN54_001778 [Arachnomyces sp. PD_36]|nr:hypothetical protein FQN54_001778 [Arachnomyces sp. PD_36]